MSASENDNYVATAHTIVHIKWLCSAFVYIRCVYDCVFKLCDDKHRK